VITLCCAWFFPNRREELNPELWAQAAPRGGVPQAAE
jgi:hypothetical protein